MLGFKIDIPMTTQTLSSSPSRSSASMAIWGLAIFHAVGLIGFHNEHFRPLFEQLVPLNLLLSAGVLAWFHRDWTQKFTLTVLSIYLFALAMEIIGVNSGLLFGEYQYDHALGAKVLGTPLIIGFNWLMPAYCSYVMLQKVFYTRWIHITAATICMVVLDIVIEPVAMTHNFWTWFGDADHTQVLAGHAPTQNYVAWFVLGWLMIFSIDRLRQRKENPIAIPLYFIQLFFFGAFYVIQWLSA